MTSFKSQMLLSSPEIATFIFFWQRKKIEKLFTTVEVELNSRIGLLTCGNILSFF